MDCRQFNLIFEFEWTINNYFIIFWFFIGLYISGVGPAGGQWLRAERWAEADLICIWMRSSFLLASHTGKLLRS